MKQNIVVVLVAFMLIFSTAAKQGKYYTINGVWSGGDNEMVYLQKKDGKTKEVTRFDSAKVVAGKFVIEGKKSLPIDEYELSTAYGKSSFVLSENPVVATVTTNVIMGKRGEVKRASIVFSGDVEQHFYGECNKAKMTGAVGVMGVAFMLPKAQEEGNKQLEDSLIQIYVSSQAAQKRIQDSLMDNFTDSYAIALLVRDISSKTEPFDKFERRYNALSDRVKKSSIGLELKAMVAMIGKAAVGNIAPDFKANTPEGKALSLSSLKGKYVLIDFWASWCSPCLAEVPNVKAVYDEYN
ncbi:MAG: TlpA disulfide reductase family protein, partial [Rikenellaceae bacterium]